MVGTRMEGWVDAMEMEVKEWQQQFQIMDGKLSKISSIRELLATMNEKMGKLPRTLFKGVMTKGGESSMERGSTVLTLGITPERVMADMINTSSIRFQSENDEFRLAV